MVDDGGTAELPPVDGLRMRLLRRERGGPGAARNDGARAAQGELLAFTDDDCLPDPGWLRALCAASAPGTMVGGRTVNALAANRFAEATQHIQDLVYAHDLDLRGFVRQHVAYGRLRDDAAFHVDRSLWLRTLRLRPPRRAAEIMALLALWQVANATGYLLERMPHPAARN